MPEPTPPSRLQSLLGFLEHDPSNETLLSDAIQTALDERAPEQALNLLMRLAPERQREPGYRALAATAQMQSGRLREAAETFEELAGQTPDPALKFNAAYSRALMKDFDAALVWLDEQTLQLLPQAATLYVQIVHQNGDADAAWDAANLYLGRFPDHAGLLSAASVLAIDLEDFVAAEALSRRAGSHPDAITTLGTVALEQGRNVEAMTMFDRVLSINPGKPRARIGRGLARMLAGDHAAAAEDIEHGATTFKDHSGSWIAAGWAHLLASRLQQARAAFEKAIKCDHNFSEAHGSLAVLLILEGKGEEGKRMAETALRLDPQSFSGAFAQSLVLTGAGKNAQAEVIIKRALATPIDDSGKTIADALVRFGLAP